MVFNATFNNISVIIVVVTFIGGGNPSAQIKPIDLLRVTLAHYIVSNTLCHE